jgi:hypothetical protein
LIRDWKATCVNPNCSGPLRRDDKSPDTAKRIIALPFPCDTTESSAAANNRTVRWIVILNLVNQQLRMFKSNTIAKPLASICIF